MGATGEKPPQLGRHGGCRALGPAALRPGPCPRVYPRLRSKTEEWIPMSNRETTFKHKRESTLWFLVGGQLIISAIVGFALYRGVQSLGYGVGETVTPVVENMEKTVSDSNRRVTEELAALRLEFETQRAARIRRDKRIEEALGELGAGPRARFKQDLLDLEAHVEQAESLYKIAEATFTSRVEFRPGLPTIVRLFGNIGSNVPANIEIATTANDATPVATKADARALATKILTNLKRQYGDILTLTGERITEGEGLLDLAADANLNTIVDAITRLKSVRSNSQGRQAALGAMLGSLR